MTDPIIVSSGDILSGITVAMFDAAVVGNGGTLEASTLEIYATLTVSAGGVASGIDVVGGTIQNAGTAISTVLSAGSPGYYPNSGKQNDLSGSVASDTLIRSGGFESISTSALSLHATVRAGGTQDVQGTAVRTVVTDEGTQSVEGGLASGTDVASGGLQSILYGSAVDTRVQSGGFMQLAFGNVQAAIIGDGAQIMDTNTDPSGCFAGTIANGGMLIVETAFAAPAADLSGTHIHAGGTLVLLDGATQTGAVIDRGGVVISATAAVFTARPFGILQLDTATSGVLSGITVEPGQSAQVYSGGHASAVTVVSKGFITIDSGGTADGTVLRNGAREYVSGVTHATMIESGGLVFNETGTSFSPIIRNGGQQLIDSGGTASAALVLAGGVECATYGIAVGTHVFSGGLLSLYTGSSRNAMIASGGVETVQSGRVDDTTVQSGGQFVISHSEAVVSGGTIEAGGLLVLDASDLTDFDQSFTGTVLAAGATALLLGAASQTGLLIAPGAKVEHAALVVFSGSNNNTYAARLTDVGSALSGTTIGMYSYEQVFAGGTAAATTVSGAQVIYSGGVAHDTKFVASNSYQFIYSGGTASTTWVLSGDQFNFGTANGGIIFSGGAQFDSAVASDTVLSGGIQSVYKGGTAYDTVVAAHGVQDDQVGGGMVYDTIVLGGGVVQLAGDGGTAITISNQGQVFVFGSAVASGTIISAGGDLRIHVGSAVDTILHPGGTIDLATFLYVSGGTATLNAGDMLTVNDGASIYQLQLASNYAGETFHLHQDSGNGTLITLSAAQQAIAAAQRGAELLPANVAQQPSATAFLTPPPPANALRSPTEQNFALIEHPLLH